MIDRIELNKRLIAAFELLKARGVVHSQSDLARSTDIHLSTINNAFTLKGRAMTQGLLNKIADAFPNIINRHFMETGEGDVALPDAELRPHFEQSAAAGFLAGPSYGEDGSDLRDINSFIPDYDFTITALGDSMLPEIHSGDILFCRFADDRFNIPYGQICVLDTINGALVKVLLPSDQDGVTIHSTNPRYRDQNLPSSQILRLAKVISILHKKDDQ